MVVMLSTVAVAGMAREVWTAIAAQVEPVAQSQKAAIARSHAMVGQATSQYNLLPEHWHRGGWLREETICFR